MTIRTHHWALAFFIAMAAHVAAMVIFPPSKPTSGAIDFGEGGLEIGLAASAGALPSGSAPTIDEAIMEPDPSVEAVDPLPEPVLEVTADPEPEPVPEPVVEVIPEPEPEAIPEPVAEIIPAPEREPVQLPAPPTEVAPEPEPEPQPEPVAEIAPDPELVPVTAPHLTAQIPRKPARPKPSAVAPPVTIERTEQKEPAPRPTTASASPPEQVAENSPDTSEAISGPENAALETAALPGASGQGASGGESATGGGAVGDVQDYFALLKSLVERHKKYPSRAQRRGQQGIVSVALAISGDGRLASVELRRSSGFDTLDRAAIDSVRQAGPFPPLPKEMNRETLRVVLPLRFEIQ